MGKHHYFHKRVLKEIVNFVKGLRKKITYFDKRLTGEKKKKDAKFIKKSRKGVKNFVNRFES